MPEYRTPGVYVEEVPSGARPIPAVGSSNTALVGLIEESDGPMGEPVACTSFKAFRRAFMESLPGDRPCTLATAVRGFFENGGSRAWVMRVADGTGRLSPEQLAPLAAVEEINLVCTPGFDDPESHAELVAHCVAVGGRFAVLDMAEGSLAQMKTPLAEGGLLPPREAHGLAAVYAPRLMVADAVTQEVLPLPPSGHVCGIYARTDETRGVHKAPANVTVSGVRGLAQAFSDVEQEVLNPLGVNLIRSFPDGIKVWGARTLAGEGSEWTYVPVRRLALMIEESLKGGLRWVVFEPNEEPLWRAVRRSVRDFLTGLWRDGALMGATQEEAFFVTCDRSTMSQDDLDNGRLICLVGVAPLRPAEFIVLRFTETVARSDVEEE